MEKKHDYNHLVAYNNKQIVKQVKKSSLIINESPNKSMSFFLKRVAKEIEIFQDLNKNSTEMHEISKDSQAPLTVVIMGEFKTGKSTFINTLLGEDCLKSDVTPATAVVTKLKYGDKKTLVAHFSDESYREYPIEMLDVLSAEGDPEGKKLRSQIRYLELSMPNPILKNLILVDTPGLNADNPLHTIATREFMNRADLVLWVFSYAKAGSRTEMAEIRSLGYDLRPIGIVNRIDEIDPDEEDVDEILDDLKKRLGDNLSHIVGVSAFEAREAQKSNDLQRLENSNWEQFEKTFKNELIGKCEYKKYKSILLKLKACLTNFYTSLISKEEEYKKYFNNMSCINNEIQNLEQKQEYYKKYLKNWTPKDNTGSLGITTKLFSLPQDIVENSQQLNSLKKSIEKSDDVLILEAEKIAFDERRLDNDIDNYNKELKIFQSNIEKYDDEKIQVGNSELKTREIMLKSQGDNIRNRYVSLNKRISKNDKETKVFWSNVRDAINKGINSISDIGSNLEKDRNEVTSSLERLNWVVQYGDILKNNVILEINQGLIHMQQNITLDGMTKTTTIIGLINKIDYLLAAVSISLNDDNDKETIKTDKAFLDKRVTSLKEYCNAAKVSQVFSEEKYFTQSNIFENNDSKNDNKKIYTFNNGNKCEITWQDNKIVGNIQCIFNDGNAYNAKFENGNLSGLGVYSFKNGYNYSGSIVNFMFNGTGTLDFNDGDKYVGEFLNDKLHGTGTYMFADGSQYKGDFENNLLYGQGIFTNAIGDKFEGKFNGLDYCIGNISYINGEYYKGCFKYLLKQGSGEFQYASGEKYIGEFKNDKVHGNGTYYFNNGNKFIGEFIENKRTGTLHLDNGNKIISTWDGEGIALRATIKYPSGDQFKGDILDYKKHGVGEYQFTNGHRFKGSFILDKRNGQGVFMIGNGDKYEGFWKDDVFIGSAKYTLNNGDFYIGEVKKDNSVVGKGKLTLNNGDKYNGNIINGIAQGHGQLITKKGKIYVGNFSNGNIDGIGVEISPLEYNYKGMFKYGKKCGQGHIVYENKKEYIGYFNNDIVCLEQGIFTFIFENGNKFEGEYLAGKQYDVGTYIFVDGNSYHGSVIENKVVGNGTYTFKNGDVYKGKFEDDIICGYGELLKNNGDKYIGEFKNNKKNGKMDLIFKNGDKICGIWDEDIIVGDATISYISGGEYKGPIVNFKKHGYGLYNLNNGDKYYGSFSNDLMNGDGTLTKENGDIYKGPFVNGKLLGIIKINYFNGDSYIGQYNKSKSGKGIYTVKNIGEYEGKWMDDGTCKDAVYKFLNGNVFYGDIFESDMYGSGKMIYSNGTKYQGEFKENMYNGRGKLFFLSKDVYEGEFNNNKMHGQGSYIYSNGEKCVGTFEKDSFIKGIYNFINGNQYSGEFLKGKINGIGTLKYSDAAVYVGEFKDGLQSGQGNFKNSKGNEFNGAFKNGKLHGKVKVQYTNGDNFDGTFRDGKKHGLGIYKYANGDLYQCEFLEGDIVKKTEILEEIKTKKESLFNFKKWF